MKPHIEPFERTSKLYLIFSGMSNLELTRLFDYTKSNYLLKN